MLLIHQLHPRQFQWKDNGYIDKLFGSDVLRLIASQKKILTNYHLIGKRILVNFMNSENHIYYIDVSFSTLFDYSFCLTILIGQILPTVPGNVFRINIKTNLDNINQNSKWVIGKQDFNLDKAGLNYFNNLVHNDSVRFAYPYDLYFNGSVYLDPNLNDTIHW